MAAPVPEFKAAPGAGTWSVDSILRSFAMACEAEESGGPAPEWGEKGGPSVFDEEWVLASHCAGEQLLAERQQPTPPVMMAAVLQGFTAMPVKNTEPRSLRLARALCCVYDLKSDHEDKCPICIENMVTGQVAWRLPCMHLVHSDCAAHYFGHRRINPICPVCRLNIHSGSNLSGTGGGSAGVSLHG